MGRDANRKVAKTDNECILRKLLLLSPGQRAFRLRQSLLILRVFYIPSSALDYPKRANTADRDGMHASIVLWNVV